MIGTPQLTTSIFSEILAACCPMIIDTHTVQHMIRQLSKHVESFHFEFSLCSWAALCIYKA